MGYSVSINVLKDIRKLFTRVDAGQIRESAFREVRIGLMAASADDYTRMHSLLVPDTLPVHSRTRAQRSVGNADDATNRYDLILCGPGVPLPRNGFLFDENSWDSVVDLIVSESEDLELALARTFPAFRTAVVGRLIQRVARENALFSVVTALPNVIPSIIELPWAVGEFASDTAFLTMNQIRLALMLSAVHGHPVGYGDLKVEIAAIVAGAFGWRAVARELAGKIPLGGGLIPKAAISFAATWVVGLGVDKARRTGETLTRAEREAAYGFALKRGREVAAELVDQRSPRTLSSLT